MKKIICIIFLLLTNAFTHAQNEASYWYFGQNAGLQFNAQSGTVTPLSNGQINTLEGCTSISDTDGNLLFYSDGQTVWNSNHQIMSNGDYFGGTGLLGDPSSTSSGLIVPKPNDPNKYYLFTVDEPHHNNASTYPNQFTGNYEGGGTVPTQDDGYNNGFNYSLIDMTLNGGLGDVDTVVKNKHLVTYDPSIPIESKYKCSEKITAVRAEDCSSFWIITHFGDKFYAFKIDENGVNETPVISTVGPNIPISGYRRNALGYLKASPDASKLIAANYGYAVTAGANAAGSVDLFNFNNETGIVSNHLELYGPQNNASPYGVEFSAENRKVYATLSEGDAGFETSHVIQWDLETTDIPNSAQVIHSSNTISAGALQLGIDRRIYRAQLSYFGNQSISKYLGVITNPEADGIAANYNPQGIFLDINGSNQNVSRLGLPPFIQSLFNSEIDIIKNGISTTELKLCTGDNYTLEATNIPGADYVWLFNGMQLAESSAQLLVDNPGFYEVYIEPNNGDCPIEGNAVVGVFEIPVANSLSNVIVCDDGDDDGITSFDFTSKNSEVLLSQDPLTYNVRYFETDTDAELGENEIIFPYNNISNPQTIFARVDHTQNPNCFAVNSFQLNVSTLPQLTTIDPVEFCDTFGDESDGYAIIDLENLKPALSGNQNENNTAITFHKTLNDANNKLNPLPLNYANSEAFNETIFVRIENTTNTACFNTSSFNVIVNPIPVARNLSIIQCDEDGIPEGFTSFNLNNHVEDITDNIENNMVTFYLSLTDAQNQEDAIDGGIFNNFLNPQIIYARVTNTNSECINFSEISLEVSTTYTNNANLKICDADGTEDGLMTFNLTEANAAVLAGSPIGLDLVYYETYSDALLETNQIDTIFRNTIPYNQTIFGRVKNANACYGISEIKLTVFELPQIETEFETFYCLNSFETIILNAGVLEDSPSNYYYEWSTGENTSQIEISSPGTYNVEVSNTNGCFKNIVITVLPSNIATISSINVVDASENNTISIFVDSNSEGDYEYALNDYNGSYQNSNTFTNVPPGLHTVYVRDKNNCGIVEDLISVIGFPKFFTPNNDAVNDYWQVYGINEQFQVNSSIYIFDRYGKLLIELDPLSSGWDGNYNGNKMPTSDYWFKVILDDGRTFTNHFTLKR
ncbi:T9SS type B sorting domain-containing protein [Winogradskyella bathintestinalis]|uniref:T9SS type B sorting domain-containing protein n=1 Tax=Winogradskyella bathintestinalis TaxID=3035208 RepID=A0ABT7ZWP9_9FLAO|nr:T9SS type B sorting domain-containing protein [Winogradskyella bathintestinalis]MDN3493440.1 T9SS type B sorting domain-containing protein [Winogradskyella bathintestinalis]